jgi:serine/threonine protein kinase
MTITEYSRTIDNTTISLEGNAISDSCRQFLEGLLEKKIANRFTFEQAFSHPWVINVKEKIEEVCLKWQHDPEKMIVELNKERLTNDYFRKKDYFEVKVSEGSDLLNKKRKRNNATNII